MTCQHVTCHKHYCKNYNFIYNHCNSIISQNYATVLGSNVNIM